MQRKQKVGKGVKGIETAGDQSMGLTLSDLNGVNYEALNRFILFELKG